MKAKVLALLFCFFSVLCFAPQYRLEWDRNTETNVVGYGVYAGSTSRVYTTRLVTRTNSIRVLAGQLTRYYTVTAINAHGLESDYSNEVYLTGSVIGPVTAAVLRVSVVLESAGIVGGPWSELVTLTNVQVVALDPSAYYRAIVFLAREQ